MKDSVDAAVEKAGKLFGDNVHDSRINNAARGDGLSVIESWIFSAERFGDTARENAHDFVRHGAGWLVQSNWKGGIETLRLGVAKATDLNCEVTWAMSIARYMEALYVHRPNIAMQLRDDYGKEPTNRSKNVIHDIPVFLGRVLKIMEAMVKEERKLKDGKPLKDARALLVTRAHNFAAHVVEYDTELWDTIEASEDMACYVGNYSAAKPEGSGGKGKGKTEKKGKKPDNLPANWKMWKPTGTTFSENQRCCDNQSCNNVLSKEKYKAVVLKQQQSDARAAARGHSKGFPSWMHCDDCDKKLKASDTAVVYPDGYMPGKRASDPARATAELKKVMQHRANRAEQGDNDAESVVNEGSPRGSSPTNLSVDSDTESIASLKYKNEMLSKEMKIKELEAETAAMKVQLAQQQRKAEFDQKPGEIKGRGPPVYSRRLHMDEEAE